MAGRGFVFWLRHQGIFWMLALPVAGLGAGIVHVVESNLEFIDYRQHWVWNLLFALIYALFLDRWIKEVLLDGADACDEVDALRRSMISPRFAAFVLLLFGLAMALAELPVLRIAGVPWLPEIVVWAVVATPLALLLPSLSAGEPLSLGEAWSAGRPVLIGLFVLIAAAALLSLLADAAATQASAELLPGKPWSAGVAAVAARLADCFLLTFVGYGLATLFREHTGWQQPAPDDHTYRGIRARKA
ncbi:MAG: hypothetical protein HYZ40_17125 [Rhodospirillales bacterium]|nr:hypothetical protein [Rhodospirillales bacterium]